MNVVAPCCIRCCCCHARGAHMQSRCVPQVGELGRHPTPAHGHENQLPCCNALQVEAHHPGDIKEVRWKGWGRLFGSDWPFSSPCRAPSPPAAHTPLPRPSTARCCSRMARCASCCQTGGSWPSALHTCRARSRRPSRWQRWNELGAVAAWRQGSRRGRRSWRQPYVGTLLGCEYIVIAPCM